MDILKLQQDLKAEIAYYYTAVDKFPSDLQPKRYIGSVLHEYVLGLLFEKGRSLGYFPLPEFMPYPDTKHRIDMVWVRNEGEIFAGFEVDKTIYPKSVKKLIGLPDGALKVIVSIGLGKYPLDIAYATRNNIHVFDFTQIAMGVYGKIKE